MQAIVQPEKAYRLTTPIRNEMESFFGTDLSTVRVFLTEHLSRTGMAGCADGSDLYFAPECFEPGSDRGRFLLVHELAHIVQQRGGGVADPGAGRTVLCLNSQLEREADTLSRLFCSGCRDSGDRARRIVGPWLEAASYQTPARGRVLQPAIVVSGAPYPGSSSPDPRIATNNLYLFLAASTDIKPPFRDVEALVKFINRCSALYASSPSVVTDPSKRCFFEKITDANVTAFRKDPSVWTAEITIQTEKGTTFRVPVFCSIKRHLILSYMSNQTRPRKTEASNSIVRDSDRFEEHLRRYAELHAASIKDNLIAFGYEPCLRLDTNAVISFKTDTTMLPNNSYTQLNGVHSFPDSGSEVRSLTPQEYHAATVFLLWFFRTDENLVEGEKFDKIRLLSPGEIDTRGKIEKARLETITEIELGLEELKKYKPPANLVGTTATDEAVRIEKTFKGGPKSFKYPNVLLQILASDIFTMLVDMGLIPAIEKPVGPVSKKTGSVPDQKKPYASGTPTALIRFKTHRYEVKQNIAHLSNDLVAWLIHGHVSLDANAILTSINSSTTATKATVREQITAAYNATKPRTSKGTPLQDTLEDFYKYYAIGVQQNLFKTRL